MKQFANYLSLGFTIAITLGFSVYVGYKSGHIVIGAIFGLLFTVGYLLKLPKNEHK